MARRPVEAERAWFERSGPSWYCSLKPASKAGWLLTALYAAAMAAISIFFLGGEEPQTVDFIAWGTLVASATFVYLLTAFRNSARFAGGCGARAKRRGSSPNAARSLLIALATALAILGAAMVGVQL